MPSCGRRSCLPLLLALVLVVCGCSVSLAAAQRVAGKPSPWQTLDGSSPLLIARGGHSALFPDSSLVAFSAAMQSSLPNTLLWCDVQLTKDGDGICLPDVRMDNCTNIDGFYPNSNRSYTVNGQLLSGFFTIDFKFADLNPVSLMQAAYSRTPRFDNLFAISSVDTVGSLQGRPHLWLNFQYDMFYSQHNFSMRSYLLSLTTARGIVIDYVSSPEISFLRSIAAVFTRRKAQLVFRFLEAEAAEPSTNQTYGSLLKNLTFIKTFASAIIVPKSYILPMNVSGYLQPSTSVVLDAHKAGLKVFAAGFANDNLIAYDYNYSPIAEYLSFVDNGNFSVDGVLSDSPVTASEAIGCFTHMNKTSPATGNLTVFSYYGASGIYPGCTDLAYKQAVDEGTDYIDCPVQVTKDGVLVCMTDINLFIGTTVAKSPFNTRSSVIPEIQSGPGVFTFNLTWEEIQKNLKPQISNPFVDSQLYRNPLHVNDGAFLSLSDFLTFANDKPLSGILISIEHAAFLAKNVGFSVTDAVLKALNDSGYDTLKSQNVIIQSTSSSVLKKMRQQSGYKLMYKIDELIGDAFSTSIKDISGFADSVAVMKASIYADSDAFIIRKTDLVTKFHEANISVYAYLFRNDFLSQAWDFFSDPIAEINTYVQDAQVDGVITEHPGTATAYRRNPCLNLGKNTPPYMNPVQPGSLEQLLVTTNGSLPPAMSPMPSLTDADVVEAPLPPSGNVSGPGGNGSPSPQLPNGQASTSASTALCLVTMIMGFLLLV